MVGVARRLRIMGSLALSLCHLAAGRVDAVCSLKPARSVDIAAAQLLVRERGLAIELLDDAAASARRRSTSRDVRASSRREPPELCATLAAALVVRIGCSGWNYEHWRDGVFYPSASPPRRWLELLRAALRHGRGEHDLLPPAAVESGRALGRARARRASSSRSR